MLYTHISCAYVSAVRNWNVLLVAETELTVCRLDDIVLRTTL